MSQLQKLGYERYIAAHAWWGKGKRSGILADAQANPHDSTAHVQRFFPPKCRSRWQWHHLVTSLTSFLHILRVGIRVSMHETWGQLFSHSFIFSFGPFGLFSSWSIWEATDPLTQLPQCLSMSGIITRQGSVLYLFNCMCLRLSWAPWVGVL